MDTIEPTLFDLPAQGAPAPQHGPQPGRKGETWACAVSATVTVLDAQALRDAASQAETNAVTMEFDADLPDDDPDVKACSDILDVLVWMVWPTDGLDDVLEAGAFRILEVDTEIVPESEHEAELSWTVKVKLTDVPALRRLAVRAHPDESVLIHSSLAGAWQSAADPFAPLHSIPGIVWRPTQVAFRHIPGRERPRGAGLA